MTDVSLRGKVPSSLYRPIFAFAPSCRFMVHAYTTFSLHRQKKSTSFPVPVCAKHTNVRQNYMTTYYSEFHKKAA